MSQPDNIHIAQQLLAGLGGGKDPDEISALFSADVQFDVDGDDNVLPWIGSRAGRGAVASFIRDLRSLTEPLRFEVEDILASDTRAVIIGELASRIIATGRTVETAFALVLTIANGEIVRFRMLEDSFAVSRAARP